MIHARLSRARRRRKRRRDQPRQGATTTTETAPSWQREVDDAVYRLSKAAPRLAATRPALRAALARTCLRRFDDIAQDWAVDGLAAKGLEPDSLWLAEEFVLGPVIAAHQLSLIAGTLEDAAKTGAPRLPGKPTVDANGRTRAPVFPTKGHFDGVVFQGFTAEVVMDNGIGPDDVSNHLGTPISEPTESVALLLGAGNVSSIGVGDALERVLLHGHPTLLKLHPHYEGLGPILERALGPLIERGWLAVTAGGGEMGAYAASDDRVGLVHVTGGQATYDRIVWGDDPDEAEQRRAANDPVLDKPVIAELGSVTPWIVVPGEWSEKELRFQAENLASALVSNGSFNCITPKVVITSRRWPQREQFMDAVREVLSQVPVRPAYYAGARARFDELIGEPVGVPEGCLPWTILGDSDPDERPELFEVENFVCVAAETALDVEQPEEFLDRAVALSNDRLAGTLGATIVVSPSTRKQPEVAGAVDRAVRDLRQGVVAFNHWAGIAYILGSAPWGGHPTSTLAEPESGIGFAHNTYLLDGFEKTVVEGPFTAFPKPVWFASHKNALATNRALMKLYVSGSVTRLPSLLLAALRG